LPMRVDVSPRCFSYAFSMTRDLGAPPAATVNARTSRGAILTGILLLFILHSSAARSETPKTAQTVVDSVGVNIHLHFGDTVYRDFPLIRRLLLQLGVKHVRDGLIDTTWHPYYERFTQLGEDGIRGTFITIPKTSSAVLVEWPSRVGKAFESFEAPNEYDNSHDPHWAETVNAFMPRLYNAVHSDPRTSAFPIIGPSTIRGDDYLAIQAAGRFFDFNNLHNYFGGRNPGTSGWGANGYGSIDANISNVGRAWPSKRLVTTETGYTTDLEAPQGIPENIEGRYMPRVFLEQLMHGVERTYIYELIDESQATTGERAFGLARNDGSAKPAFLALQNLLRIVADPGPPASVTDLNYSLLGASPHVHHLLLQKRNGTYDLAIWQEVLAYDVDRKKLIPVPEEKVVFHSPQKFRSAALWQFQESGEAAVEKLHSGSEIPITVTDRVSILELR
jgi:hypothetical protein